MRHLLMLGMVAAFVALSTLVLILNKDEAINAKARVDLAQQDAIEADRMHRDCDVVGPFMVCGR